MSLFTNLRCGCVPWPSDSHVAYSESVDPQKVQHHGPLVVHRRLVRVPVITVAVNRATAFDNHVA
jgi:hypothetical protein